MAKFIKKVAGIGCIVALLATTVFAQQSTSAPGTGQANTLTGGAEGTTTDRGTPQGAATSSPQQDGKGMSGSSSGQANTLTGGAEGAPTDQATPSGGAAAPSSNMGKPDREVSRDDGKASTGDTHK